MKSGAGIIVFVLVVSFLSMISFASASGNNCKLDVSLLNQDPYPAVPGDYVKLVFQVSGVDSPNCNDITFNLLPDYPIEFNPGESGMRTFNRVDYIKDFKSNLLIPYKVRIDKNALDGDTPVDIRVQSKYSAPLYQKFNIKVKDVRAKFEVYVKDYNYNTHEMTLEVLNIGSSDIEALTVGIPKQKSIQVKGSNKNTVGDLNSNEYTSAEFEAVPSNGNFTISLEYSDAINVRRVVTKEVTFDSSYFTGRIADEKTTSIWTYLLYVVVVLALAYWFFRKRKK